MRHRRQYNIESSMCKWCVKTFSCQAEPDIFYANFSPSILIQSMLLRCSLSVIRLHVLQKFSLANPTEDFRFLTCIDFIPLI